MKNFRSLSLLPLAFLATSAIAQDGARWYQIELTIFAHENSNTTVESWRPEELELEFPPNPEVLDSLLAHLTLSDWSMLDPTPELASVQPESGIGSGAEIVSPEREENPEAPQAGDYQLPDPARDAYVELPASEHNFTDSNRSLTSSPAYRVLYHTAWRQPVLRAGQATPVAIAAGRQFDDRHELEGSITIRFNQSRDRVVLDTNLWLTEFSRVGTGATEPVDLPALPAELVETTPTTATQSLNADSEEIVDAGAEFYARQVFPMQGSRDMRSNEFHYLDHPAIGILVQVFPYEPPPEPTPFPGSELPF